MRLVLVQVTGEVGKFISVCCPIFSGFDIPKIIGTQCRCSAMEISLRKKLVDLVAHWKLKTVVHVWVIL